MKFIIKTLAVVTTATLLVSCSDFLDTTRYDALSSDVAITNLNDANAALLGVYDGVQGSSSSTPINRTTYYASRMVYYGDVRGDDMQASRTGNRTSATYEMRYTKDNAPAIWVVPYNVIRRANNVIKALEDGNVTDGSQEEINLIKGQALALRALAYFDLVRVHGKPYVVDNGTSWGVPIVIEPAIHSSVPSRNTVDEVYTRVIDDLGSAITLLATSTTPRLGFVNVWAVKALLCRVYLYKGDNQNALSLAQDIITNSPYTLWSNSEYADVWAEEGTSEVIFEIINYDTSDWGDREGIGYLMSEQGYCDMIVTTAFNDLLNEDLNDVRHSIVDAPVNEANIREWGTEKIFCNKFRGKTGSQIPIANIPILRLSEVYLNGAEAAVKLGGSNGPIAADYIKAIAERANPATTESFTAANVDLSRVLKERRKELVGEGHRFFDLMRNNLTCTRYTSDADRGRHYILTETASRQFTNQYYRTILPIPVAEMNANPSLKDQQNPEY